MLRTHPKAALVSGHLMHILWISCDLTVAFVVVLTAMVTNIMC